jgi:di/tricarboxylate transporter
MSKMLGRPKILCVAQLRLMIPVGIASAFFNNTPLVAIMIPIVQSWAKKINMSDSQLLMHLSFASILGGTITIIGTSTNLVVAGLLGERYPNEFADEVTVELFDVAIYGVPVMLLGFAYMITFSSFLLPNEGGSGNGGGADSILVSARVLRWSPACDNTVADSGLRGLPGLFLVTVHKQSTGATIRAVGPDLVLQEGDQLDFTGVVENFGRVCEEYSLEPVTHETAKGNGDDPTQPVADDAAGIELPATLRLPSTSEPSESDSKPVQDADWGLLGIEDDERFLEDSTDAPASVPSPALQPHSPQPPGSYGARQTADVSERLWMIQKLRDVIRNESSAEAGSGSASGRDTPTVADGDFNKSSFKSPLSLGPASRTSPVASGAAAEEPSSPNIFNPSSFDGAITQGIKKKKSTSERQPAFGELLNSLAPATIVVTPDPLTSKKNVILIGVNASDRPALLHDLSKGMKKLSLQTLHNEASVVGLRSISVWRCEVGGGLRAERRRREGVDETDIQEIWSVLHALLETESGTHAIKQRGLRVIRATIPPGSSLIGKSAEVSEFKNRYLSAIVALQRNGTNPVGGLKNITFASKDVLILQVGEDSILLTQEFSRAMKRVDARGTGSVTPTDNRDTPRREMRRGLRSFVHSSSEKLNKSMPGAAAEAKLETRPDSFQGDDDVGVASMNGDNSLEQNQASMDSLASDLRVVSNIYSTIEEGDENEEDDGQSNEILSEVAVGREFLTAYYVSKKSPLIGKTVKEAGIGSLPNAFLVSIERPVSDSNNNLPASAVDASPAQAAVSNDAKVTISIEEKLEVNDILWWSGDGAGIGELRKIPGLSPFENSQVKKLGAKNDRRLVQAVVARTGPLVGKTIKELKFRTRFNCAVISVQREGTRIQQHTGRIALQAGDVLLLEAGSNFVKDNADNSRCFALLSEIEGSASPRMSLLIPSLFVTLVMLALYMARVATLLETGLCASILMVYLGILTQQEARDAVNWEIYVTIASAFGIGTAMVNSGVAGGIASFLVNAGGKLGLGSSGLFAMVYLATVTMSNVVTNNAAAALIFPIAMDAAEQGGVSLINMAFCIMLSASASFMTPFGYQTNLMVYGPGRYKTTDFLRFGTPMQLLLWLWTVALLGVGDSAAGSEAVFAFWAIGGIMLFLAAAFNVVLWKRDQKPDTGETSLLTLDKTGHGSTEPAVTPLSQTPNSTRATASS